jgi:hypothetical protein
LDGNGLAVSVGRGGIVEVWVGVTEAACVAVAAKRVFVAGASNVFVGIGVSMNVSGIGVEVRVQANELIMPRIKIASFCLISEICSPLRIIYSHDREVKKFLWFSENWRGAAQAMAIAYPRTKLSRKTE